MNNPPSVHKNYSFVNANIVIRALQPTGSKILFRAHRARLSASSTVLGGILDAEIQFGPKIFTADGTPVVDVSEGDFVWQAILGYCYNRADDSNLQNIPLAKAIDIWKASHYYGLHPLVNTTEALILGTTCNWTPKISLDLYLSAKKMAKQSMEERAWEQVKAEDFLSFSEGQLCSLAVVEVVRLAKHNLAKITKQNNSGGSSGTNKKRKF